LLKAIGQPDKGAIFKSEGGRLSAWINHLEKFYNKQDTSNYFFGSNPVTGDFAVFTTILGLNFVFGAEEIAAMLPEGLSKFYSLMASRPSYDKFLAKETPILFPSAAFGSGS
jgi:hypothetical protein